MRSTRRHGCATTSRRPPSKLASSRKLPHCSIPRARCQVGTELALVARSPRRRRGSSTPTSRAAPRVRGCAPGGRRRPARSRRCSPRGSARMRTSTLPAQCRGDPVELGHATAPRLRTTRARRPAATRARAPAGAKVRITTGPRETRRISARPRSRSRPLVDGHAGHRRVEGVVVERESLGGRVDRARRGRRAARPASTRTARRR